MQKCQDITVVYAGSGSSGAEAVTLVPRSYSMGGEEVAQHIAHLRSDEGAQERRQLGLETICAVWVLPTAQFARMQEGFPTQIKHARDLETLFLNSKRTAVEREWEW